MERPAVGWQWRNPNASRPSIPNGIGSFSPGLRGTRYPRSNQKGTLNSERVESFPPARHSLVIDPTLSELVGWLLGWMIAIPSGFEINEGTLALTSASLSADERR